MLKLERQATFVCGLRSDFADGHAGFRRCSTQDMLHAGGATISIDYPDAPMAVTTYYGRYPVPGVNIQIIADNGDRVITGITYGDDMEHPLIRI